MSMRTLVLVMLTVLMAALLLSGCGGGGGDDGGGVQRGSVQGRVVAYNAETQTTVGQGGITITLIGGGTSFSGTSSASGDFVIQRIPVGTYEVQVTAPDLTDLVLPPGVDIPDVTVLANDTTPMGTMLMIDSAEVPPDPA